jgi:uncharacterized membrane protein YhaH (DUF805 family)
MNKDLLPLLFGFKGRIQRLYWWVATIAVGAVAGIVTTLLEHFARSSGEFIPDAASGEIAPTGIFGAAITAIGLANLWINLALSVKRLHDRDRTGAWVFLQILLVFLAVIMIIVAIAVPKEQNGPWVMLAGLTGAIAFAFSVWLFVELGFLRGTRGPNRFGPDQLGTPEADAKL